MVHPSYCFYLLPVQCHGLVGVHPSCLLRGRLHPGQSTSSCTINGTNDHACPYIGWEGLETTQKVTNWTSLLWGNNNNPKPTEAITGKYLGSEKWCWGHQAYGTLQSSCLMYVGCGVWNTVVFHLSAFLHYVNVTVFCQQLKPRCVMMSVS